MLLFASYTAQDRTGLKRGGYTKSFLIISLTTSIILSILLLLKIISFKPNEFIPVAGMIVGNSLNVYSLVVDRLKGEIEGKLDIIENIVAIGATLKEAIFFIKNNAIKNALIPTLNMLQTIGIIHIPGVTTGMLLAGADPLKAISYQLIILYSIVSTAVLTAFFTVHLLYREIFITVIFKK
jgi:putative ABC transport system permease protein